MKYRFIREESTSYPVRRLCQVLEVSASGFYAWLRRGVSQREQEDRRLRPHIRAAFQGSRQRYGSPRITRDLMAAGERVGRKRVARLMKSEGLQARPRRRFRVTTDSRHGHPIAENVLNRGFSEVEPNVVWLADITYLRTPEGWLYLAVVLDLASRRVVGFSMSERINQALTLGALEMALGQRRPAPGLLHHSDRGSQYAAHAYQNRLHRAGCQVSMSRKGNCWDNAPMESFFSTLKTELANWFPSRAQARREVFVYIQAFYNQRRAHSALGYLSPANYENQLIPGTCRKRQLPGGFRREGENSPA
jgi:putative transposase